ncbi:MAG: enoyl-CoA hydratase, partial [Gammaproteobacteria bacterium]|nr:enoyl-CoA hydratase [Gammaproteobacteria bacterium]
GELVSAAKAQQIGLVNKVVEDAILSESSMAMARLIAAKSSMTVATGKQAFYRQGEMSVVDAYQYTSGIMVDNLLKQDAQEGIKAFIEKRSPKWQDK